MQVLAKIYVVEFIRVPSTSLQHISVLFQYVHDAELTTYHVFHRSEISVRQSKQIEEGGTASWKILIYYKAPRTSPLASVVKSWLALGNLPKK